MAGWDTLQDLVKEELKQREEEGYRVEGFADKVEAAGDNEAKLTEVYQALMALPIRADFPFSEPDDLAAIRQERPNGPRKLQESLTETEWRDKFHGAWLGRSVGCALGKPLEAPDFMDGGQGNPGWKNVQLWFQGADAWPIRGYTPGQSRARDQYGIKLLENCSLSLEENICFMESDDDIRYTVLGLLMLEEKGLDWDSWDVGKMWHLYLTYRQVCTAEAQAYINFAQVLSRLKPDRPQDWETQKKNWVRTHLNPYREWIGAQIRVDGYAYGAAGHPELAAELAWRDASFSHVKNGIYGAMFVSAMIAAAFLESDPAKIVEIGLSEIPRRSRLANDIARAVEIAKSSTNQVELVDRIWQAFKHYHSVHTNNNAALVAASLVFAKGDFETAVTTAVLGGWDTDCNGATVGSIMGAILGADSIPDRWKKPLNDKLYAEVKGFQPIAISECSERSYAVFRKLNGTKVGG